MKALELAMDLVKAISIRDWLGALELVESLRGILDNYKRSC